MKKKIKISITIIFLLSVFTSISGYAQNKDSLTIESKYYFAWKFRSAQLDFTAVPLISLNYGGSVDFNFLHFPNSTSSGLGFRFGLERYFIGSPGGSLSGSPFFDYNVLTRLSTSGRVLQIDIYGGLTYNKTTNNGNHPSRFVLKEGVELRIKILGNFFGILAKAYGYGDRFNGGLGIYIGFPG